MKLRHATNAGMMDCKKALQEAEGDFDKAVDIIRKRGLIVASKRADREAKEGCVLAHAEGKKGVLVSLNCETDFVAKNENFINFTKQILDAAFENMPADKDALLALQIGGRSIADQISEQTGVIGEKLELAYYGKIEAEATIAYIHPGNKLATVIGFNKDADTQVKKDIAMQAAAMAPIAVDKNDVPQEVIAHELEIGRDKAREEGSYVKKVNFNGEDKLFYPSFPIDVALIHASYVDTQGNCSLEEEGTLADILPIAQAAYTTGGKVIVTVEKSHYVEYGSLDTRFVQVPGIYIAAIVLVDSDCAKQTNGSYHNEAFSGEKRIPMSAMEPMKMNARKIIARRCAMELKAGAVVNLGIGMPEGVANIVAEEGIEGMVLTTESGTIGGVPASGGDFGVTTNPDTILHQSFQFDFYDGGGLDIAFLGLAQCDSHGNINVSKFGPKIAGCGGFINITQNTPVVVFCGTFTVKGKNKFLKDVEQITFSADFANKTGQKVLYVTECCVFKLTKEGVELIEVAPGLDIEKDILAHMDFKPIIKDVKVMDERIFKDELMGLAK